MNVPSHFRSIHVQMYSTREKMGVGKEGYMKVSKSEYLNHPGNGGLFGWCVQHMAETPNNIEHF